MGDGAQLAMVANLGPANLTLPMGPVGRLLWGSAVGNAAALAPWSVIWSIEA